jgi:predicted DNA-binding protein with PD1-like motif
MWSDQGRAAVVHFRRINDDPSTFLVVLDPGDEAISTLTTFAREQHLAASQITAIGAFERTVLGYFDRSKGDYNPIPLDEQVEVLSIVGDIVGDGEDLKVHLHAVVGRHEASTRGGHLLEGIVWPTLEVIITESPVHLRRRYVPEVGIPLIAT